MNLVSRMLDAQLAHLERFVGEVGYGRTGSIAEHVSFREWCEDLARKGLKVDQKPFKLANRPALVPIYDAIPTTREDAANRRLIIQKATQLGLTVWEVLADIYMAKKWGPINIGMFLPSQSMAAFKSEHRFMPIVRSAPDILYELTHRIDQDGGSKRLGEGNVLTRQIAQSLLMFLWTTGKVTTESRPMDVVSLDEVQEMSLASIDKVMARMGDSDISFALMLSTANLPDLDINFWYQQGSQEVWNTRCSTCHDLFDLSDPHGIFPSRSIAFNVGQVPPAAPGLDGTPASEPAMHEYLWVCPGCEHHIPDPQVGEYVVNNPGASPMVRSFLLPRTISPRMTPRDMIESFGRAKTGDQKKSFYNRTLARPYIDAEQLPVTMAHCMAAVEAGRLAGVTWEKSGAGYFMGLDQMGGFNAAIIKKRLPDNRQAVVHVEAIFDADPFERCSELMRLYQIEVCVVEQLPNFNDARRFAHRHLGKVFLTTQYAKEAADAIRWGDDLSNSDRHTNAEDRNRYTVTLQQYKCMQTSLIRVRDKICLFPDPNLLEQDVVENGATRRMPILHDWVFMHFTKTALVVEQDAEQRKLVSRVKKIGLDPHFSFANMLCDVAWARRNGQSMFILPEGFNATQPDRSMAERVEKAMPGLPVSVIGMLEQAPIGSCGRCSAFQNGHCTDRNLTVGFKDPGCVLFDARSDPS
jgi:hypothetical protein